MVGILEKSRINVIDWHSKIQLIIGNIFTIPNNQALVRVIQEWQHILSHHTETSFAVLYKLIVSFIEARLKLWYQNFFTGILQALIDTILRNQYKWSIIQSTKDRALVLINSDYFTCGISITEDCMFGAILICAQINILFGGKVKTVLLLWAQLYESYSLFFHYAMLEDLLLGFAYVER